MLDELLARNAAHVAGLAPDHFDGVLEAQHPSVVAMGCADSRVLVERMWSVEEPGWLFTPQTLGNQAWERVDGERVLHSGLAYPVHLLATRTVVVVGHTGCGAIQAALAGVRGGTWPEHPAIRASVEALAPVVERGLASIEGEPGDLLDRLVERNVHEQVAFLLGAGRLPGGTRVHGFVYDLHGSYGGPRGRAHLVNSDGERRIDRLAGRVRPEHADHVASLL